MPPSPFLQVPGLQTALTCQPTPPTVSTGRREHVERQPPSAAPPPARPATPRRTQSRPARANARAHRGHAPPDGRDGGGSCGRAAEGALSEWFRGSWSPAVDTESVTRTSVREAAGRERPPRVRRPGTLDSRGLRVGAGRVRAAYSQRRFDGARPSTKLSSGHRSQASSFLQSPLLRSAPLLMSASPRDRRGAYDPGPLSRAPPHSPRDPRCHGVPSVGCYYCSAYSSGPRQVLGGRLRFRKCLLNVSRSQPERQHLVYVSGHYCLND